MLQLKLLWEVANVGSNFGNVLIVKSNTRLMMSCLVVKKPGILLIISRLSPHLFSSPTERVVHTRSSVIIHQSFARKMAAQNRTFSLNLKCH